MTDDNNKDSNPDFEDDVFDETSFDENYYEDDAAFDEADLPDDAEFEDVDFEETDWNEDDDDVGPVAGKKEKSLYRAEKKSFLSFNTIVILGAFVVGAGVLAFTVMGQSSKVSSSMVPKFISSLNIGDVMDGGLFGGGTEDVAITGEGTSPEDTTATQDTGFLDNPDGIELQATSTDLPPQPSPISPTEMAPDTALTPMPEILDEQAAVQDDGMIPRGPDEAVAVTQEPAEADDGVANVSADAAQPSAEDILKRALAKRDQPKEEAQTEEVAVVEETAEEIPVGPVAIPEPVAAAPVPVPVAEVAAQPEPVKEPVVEKPASAPVVAEVSAASDEAIKSLESKIDTMLKRMEQIETELSTVREGRDDEYESLEKTVSSLKGDIVALKKAPVPKPQAAPKEETKPVVKTETKKAVAPVKREEPAYSPPKPAAPTTPAPVVQQAATWELRAAQPGKAWVSKTGQRDMQGVVVGETLQGIGRITAISYQNGRWVVTGTQGQIRQ